MIEVLLSHVDYTSREAGFADPWTTRQRHEANVVAYQQAPELGQLVIAAEQGCEGRCGYATWTGARVRRRHVGQILPFLDGSTLGAGNRDVSAHWVELPRPVANLVLGRPGAPQLAGLVLVHRIGGLVLA